ncbi:hemolysin XhlA family protein [bacterium]|nr:hemolysin XhlA family protein [bacterium]
MAEEKKFEIEVLTRLTKIETMLEDFKGIEQKSSQAYELSLRNKERLDKIEDNNRWLFRTSIGAVITGLIGIALAFLR